MSLARTTEPDLLFRRFWDAYLDCALWASVGDDGEPLDSGNGRPTLWGDGVLLDLRFQARLFWDANVGDVWSEPERAGHDFWLTRNGHGAGFWDGDWPDAVGDRLTKASEAFGSCDLYVGDDGRLYSYT